MQRTIIPIIFAHLFIFATHSFAQNDPFELVDETDSRIHFTGQWSFLAGHIGQEFDGGDGLTREQGATATFSFSGTAISVYGAISPADGHTTVSTYTIDDGTPVSYTAPAIPTASYSVLFYSSPVLSPGEHTLKITNLNDQGTYRLDYLNFTPPVSTMDTLFQIVDDVNPRIQYGGLWMSLVGFTTTFNGTLKGTNEHGATATLSFSGTAISVYGVIGPIDQTPTVSTYIIDDSTPVSYTAPAIHTNRYRALFYSSPVLSPGEHTLKVTNLIDQGTLWLDYFNITTLDSTTDASSVQTPIASSSSVQPSAANATSVQPSAANATSIQSSAVNATSVQPSGANTTSVQPSGATAISGQPSSANAASIQRTSKGTLLAGVTSGVALGTTCLLAFVL